MNFSYLEQFTDFKQLKQYCDTTEAFVSNNPIVSAVSARQAMEYFIKFIYKTVIVGENVGCTIFEMVTDDRFIKYINDDTLIHSIHYIRKMGNVAVHGGDITVEEAGKVLEELHFLVGELFVALKLIEDYPVFEKPGNNYEPVPKVSEKDTSAQKVEISEQVVAKYAATMRKTRFDVKYKRNEEENKKLFLRASLREAGWPIATVNNQALPSIASINMVIDTEDKVDYMLNGTDNKPLAIVEFTTTSKNPIEGRNKAVRMAEKLAVKYGYKPIIYYTSGYAIFCIDQLGYKPRRVFGFHDIKELELLKQRAVDRKDIRKPEISDEITNRQYQKDAIATACNVFSDLRRRTLLVMATGTGKTRVSISLVKVLMENNWVKNVLFLADRTSLVRQAHKNFNKLLPNATTSIYSGGNIDRDENARIIFATYQTMINLINDDTREFGIGRFDLIIVDEAHRSIFRKYKALFNYFDALMLGLTATPRYEECKSTYEVFELPNSEPDFAYELEQAIDDKYLVGFSILDRTTKRLKRGFKYNELSQSEKDEIEANLSETLYMEDEDFGSDLPELFYAGVFKEGNIINVDTIRVMLKDLMDNGLKVNGNETLGKTIIFASSHAQAEVIVKVFKEMYGHLGEDFCKLIDSKVPDNLTLIDKFGERDSMPQVAVSVDMMDTGIDVPDVLNLVFFKIVKSKIKFLQMIGRGTRLSKDIFGPEMDKQGFLIFDYYDNFEYFSMGDTWTTVGGSSVQKQYWQSTASERIHKNMLNILGYLQRQDSLTEFEEKYKNDIKDYFVERTRNLCNDNIDVQYNMAYVSKYRTEESWDLLNDEKIEEINEKLIPIYPGVMASAKVRNFDAIMYTYEWWACKKKEEGEGVRAFDVDIHLMFRMNDLLKITNIPAVAEQEELILKVRNKNYLGENFSLKKAEEVRVNLRDLMNFIPDKKHYVIIDLPDDPINGGENELKPRAKTYEEKVNDYILNSKDPILAKLRNIDSLTLEEIESLNKVFTNQLGSEADYASWSGNKPLVAFVRHQVGIAEEAIKVKFGSFLNDQIMDEQQLIYMNNIVEYAKENGDVTFTDLMKVSPFCDVDVMELFGEKIIYVKQLVNTIHNAIV